MNKSPDWGFFNENKYFTHLELYNNINRFPTIEGKIMDNQIIIKIQDNGIGIPENIKEKIFKPFFTTKPTGQGTGLGLSLSYDIITKGHGGSLEVESEMGAFTLFIIKLPLSLPQPK